jgi:hypothetical protein
MNLITHLWLKATAGDGHLIKTFIIMEIFIESFLKHPPYFHDMYFPPFSPFKRRLVS